MDGIVLVRDSKWKQSQVSFDVGKLVLIFSGGDYN